jgi:hypothetical protein
MINILVIMKNALLTVIIAGLLTATASAQSGWSFSRSKDPLTDNRVDVFMLRPKKDPSKFLKGRESFGIGCVQARWVNTWLDVKQILDYHGSTNRYGRAISIWVRLDTAEAAKWDDLPVFPDLGTVHFTAEQTKLILAAKHVLFRFDVYLSGRPFLGFDIPDSKDLVPECYGLGATDQVF